MKQLDRDILHLQTNLNQWHSLYGKSDLARAKRLLAYMTELRNIRRGNIVR